MPQKKRKIPTPDGREVDAVFMPFQQGAEHWNEYLVDDGTVVRIKLVVTEILKVEGEYDQQGNPIYVVQSTSVMSVNAPENLMKDGR